MATDPIHAALLQRMLGPGGPGGGPPGPDAGPPPGGGGAPPDGSANGKGVSPLEGVQSVIQDLHKLMELHPDPQAVSVIATCLKAMTALQGQMMAQKGGGPGAG
jgi:hypothetical protein